MARADTAAVQPGESEALRAESTRLRHLDELTAAAAAAAELLSPAEGEGAQSLTARAGESVAAAAEYEPDMAAVAAELRDAAARLQESAVELRGFVDGLEADSGRLEHVEARLELFAQLERRYAAPLEQVLAMAADARAALERLDGSQSELERLADASAAAAERARACAAELTAARTAAAPAFAAPSRRSWPTWAWPMPASASASSRPTRGRAGPTGSCSSWRPTRACPPGRWPTPPRAASCRGSRLRSGWPPAPAPGPGVLLLDEVDAGIGGRTARAVAGKLQQLAEAAQVLVITHLPQIASVADAHFRVEKLAGDPTATAIVRLKGGEVVDELARMLGGEEGDEAARRHAEALAGGGPGVALPGGRCDEGRYGRRARARHPRRREGRYEPGANLAAVTGRAKRRVTPA